MWNLLASCSMAIACRRKRGGVIVNEHTLTAAQTRFHVEVLGRWFEFIHHDDLLPRIARPGARPFCLLTFDDGKRSHATVVASELERLGVPAVFYLPTEFVTRQSEALWFDRYEALLKAVGHAPPGLEPAIVTRLPYETLCERLDRACATFGVTPDWLSDDVRPMTWSQARALAQRGFTIGAHGKRHAILTCEAEAVALAEVEESIAEVTNELGSPCPSFAFPNGNYTPLLARCALECGVRTVMTTEPIWVGSDPPLWRLPRVQLFGEASRAWIETKLAAAASGWILPNPDGTGWAYRRARSRKSMLLQGTQLPGPGEDLVRGQNR